MAQLASTTVFGELLVTANSLLQGNVGVGTTSPAYALDVSGDVRATGTFRGSLTGNASTATTLATARTINGTSFNGSANITTANWGTARTLTIGSTGKSVNGSANVSWTLAEIGAAPASHTHSNISITAGNGLSGGGTLAANRTITLGTPGTITTSTSNSVTSTSHTHALTLPTTATRWPSWSEVTGKPSTFPPSTHTHSQYELPSGVIVMWSGSIASIPSGWALCDGSNGTPDLRDRFIVGAGGSYDVGDTGGSNTVTLTTSHLPRHSHTVSIGEAGNHNHTGTTSLKHIGSDTLHIPSTIINKAYNETAEYPVSDKAAIRQVYSTPINTNHSHTFTTSSNGSHRHSITINSTGGDQAHENRPPYYALAYIMKL